MGKFVAGEHGRKTFAQSDGRRVRQNLGVAPHGSDAAFERFFGETGFQRCEIIAGVENATVFRANSLWSSGSVVCTAFSAFEIGDFSHIESLADTIRAITVDCNTDGGSDEITSSSCTHICFDYAECAGTRSKTYPE